MPKTILFLCSGNYYRSRFAENLFNHRAAQAGLDWRATSRGLKREFGAWNIGPMFPGAIAALRQLGVEPDESRCAMHCYESDLRGADLIVALKEAEHRPLLDEHFPAWASRVEFWQVHDLDFATPEQALPEIEQLIEQLIDRLHN